jgi:hypothetical protein
MSRCWLGHENRRWLLQQLANRLLKNVARLQRGNYPGYELAAVRHARLRLTRLQERRRDSPKWSCMMLSLVPSHGPRKDRH